MVVLIFTKWCINWDERMLAATCEFLDPNTNTWVPCPDATSTCYVHGNYPETGRCVRDMDVGVDWLKLLQRSIDP